MSGSAGRLAAVLTVGWLCGCQADTTGGGGAPTAIEGPATWSAIYADYFEPSGAASCGGDRAGCHSSNDDAGVVVSKLLCTTADDCFATMTGASGLITAADADDPASAKLFRFLRTPGGTGKMPQDSDFEFQDGDIARLQEWIANGATNE